MAYFHKIGLLVLNKDASKFLVCEKAPDDMTSEYIMPGGQLMESSIEECLRNEISEELGCEVDFSTLDYINSYTAPAAGDPENSKVTIELFTANLIGEPKPSREIKFIHWIGREDQTNLNVSYIVRELIIPDLVRRHLLR